MYFYELVFVYSCHFGWLAVVGVHKEERKTVADCRQAVGNGWGVSGGIPPTQNTRTPDRREERRAEQPEKPQTTTPTREEEPT